MTIASTESIDFFLDIEEVRPNVSSDFPFGVTDGESLLYYRNNGLGNGSASPVLVSSYSETSDGAVYDYNYEYRAVVISVVYLITDLHSLNRFCQHCNRH